jgi:glucokinase
MAAVLVDLGGTHLRFALLRERESAQVLQRSRIRNFRHGIGSREIWDNIVTAITDFITDVQQLVPCTAPIILSFPGPVTNHLRVEDAPTVAGSSGIALNLPSMLATRTGRTVHILNDISAAAWHVSRSIKARRFMVVTVSSGIGSKIFDRDHPCQVIDDISYAGEIGHLKVDETPNAPVCDCGGKGHLGAISSGRGIERCARRLLSSAGVNNEHDVVPAARAGNAQMLDLIRECTRPLARILLQTVIAAGLERVVVIGGFALSLGEIYRAILQREITQQCDYRVAASRIENLIVMGDEDSSLLGTAAYASRIL